MNRFLLSLVFLISIYFSTAQTTVLTDRWSYNTSFIMPKGKWESGIFQPFRFGLSPKMEIRSTILLFPILPNAGIKIKLGESGGFNLASEHQLSIPSVFLNTISRKGTGGLLSPEFDFPFILDLYNSILASRILQSNSLLSFKAGINIAIRSGSVDPLATIDLPLFYPRMAQYYKGTSIRLAAGYKRTLLRRWDIEEGLQLFLVTRKNNNLNIENTGNINFTANRSLRLKAGYILTYGSYPFGTHWQLWPTLDLVFGSKLP